MIFKSFVPYPLLSFRAKKLNNMLRGKNLQSVAIASVQSIDQTHQELKEHLSLLSEFFIGNVLAKTRISDI